MPKSKWKNGKGEIQELRTFSEEKRKQIAETAWNLRVIQRYSYRRIAAVLHLSTFAVHSLVKELAKTRAGDIQAKNKDLQCKQNEIYEALLDRWLPVALDKSESREQSAMAATDRVTKVLLDQAKLHGFHMIKDTTIPSNFGKEIGIAVIEAMGRLASKQKVIEAEVVTPELNAANP